MAYGQTGSGKTYTMMGSKEDPGVNVRAIRELLRICTEREQITYTLKVRSLVEIKVSFLEKRNKKVKCYFLEKFA